MINCIIDSRQGRVELHTGRNAGYHDIKTALKNILRKTVTDQTHIFCISDFSLQKTSLTTKELYKLNRLLQKRKRSLQIRHAHISHPEDELNASVLLTLLRQKNHGYHACVFNKKHTAHTWLGISDAASDGALSPS
jgi:two-component sensor histidine kinase